MPMSRSVSWEYVLYEEKNELEQRGCGCMKGL